MLIDAFQRLGHAGFDIPSYQYTGFGSIYFVDFIMFHKLLGIHKMLSVEHDAEISKRVIFNKPFDGIKIEIGSIGDFIPDLSADCQHILWLDYDDILHSVQLQDLVHAGTYLSRGSILLVTLDVEPPEGKGPKDWKKYFDSEAEDYLGHKYKLSDFSRSKLTQLNVDVLEAAIIRGIAGRDVHFWPLFYFSYADGHEMITIGGMIGTEGDRRRLKASTVDEAIYYRDSLRENPFRVSVPRVTRKERLYLDCSMPCSDHWGPTEFELSGEEVLAYRAVYRFFPAYAELLL
jgi:hypothetical protein